MLKFSIKLWISLFLIVVLWHLVSYILMLCYNCIHMWDSCIFLMNLPLILRNSPLYRLTIAWLDSILSAINLGTVASFRVVIHGIPFPPFKFCHILIFIVNAYFLYIAYSWNLLWLSNLSILCAKPLIFNIITDIIGFKSTTLLLFFSLCSVLLLSFSLAFFWLTWICSF